MSEVTKRIDQLLDERGIDKQTFYDDCHISSAAYSQWNTGKTSPRKSSLIRVANYLGSTYEWIAFGTGNKKAPTDDDERRERILRVAKVALFGGDTEVTDEMWQEAVFAAELIKQRHNRKKD